jgi:hypothetical protein
MTFQLKTELLISLNNWQAGLNKANRQMTGFGKSMKTISNGVKASVAGIGSILTTQLVGGWIKAAEEARRADQRLDNVAKTINVFGKDLPKVTDRLKEFADQQEISTGITAEEIKAAQTKILTYSAVAKSAGKMGGIFDRTTMAAIDLAAAGFGSVEGNADTLGKALANPIKGLAALERQGFTYSEKTKKQFATWIKQGKLWKAQEYILKDIESQVKGTAEASGSSLAKLENAFGQITDEIGKQFLPVMDKMVEWFQSSEGKAAVQEWMDKINELGAYFSSAEFGEALDTWAGRIEDLLTLIGGLLDGLNEFLAAVDSAQPENSQLLKDVDAATGSTATSDAVKKSQEEFAKGPLEWFFGGGKDRSDAALKTVNTDPGAQKLADKTNESLLDALGPFKEIGRWFGETSGQFNREPAPPTVNVSVSPITGKQTVDIINNYGKTKGVVPGSMFN